MALCGATLYLFAATAPSPNSLGTAAITSRSPAWLISIWPDGASSSRSRVAPARTPGGAGATPLAVFVVSAVLPLLLLAQLAPAFQRATVGPGPRFSQAGATRAEADAMDLPALRYSPGER